eukprot:scaffold2117_cov82-Skeletonema_dohrnii-CCMP3373.AAC.5
MRASQYLYTVAFNVSLASTQIQRQYLSSKRARKTLPVALSNVVTMNLILKMKHQLFHRRHPTFTTDGSHSDKT